MREFQDDQGQAWSAEVRTRPGLDYKGRYYFLLYPADTSEEALELRDLRWNSRKTAERTLRTMSDVELRRRLRQARGRWVHPGETMAELPGAPDEGDPPGA